MGMLQWIALLAAVGSFLFVLGVVGLVRICLEVESDPRDENVPVTRAPVREAPQHHLRRTA